MKIRNMQSPRGNDVPNQFIIETSKGRYFQSYDSIIAFLPWEIMGNVSGIKLDENYWDYSRTTMKYLCQFLRHHTSDAINSKKDIEQRIESGYYQLVNLNQE